MADKKLPPHLRKLIDWLPLNTPVHQSVIFEKYGRKPEYARRIRKIVSEYGWDIERRRDKSGANDDYYIRRSDGPVRPQRIRREVSPKRRKIIYERDNWICQLCRDDVGPDQTETNPQCDHKVPAERGGRSSNENLHTLCVQCNLKKRQACKKCQLESCEACEYAFPERLDSVIVLRLSAHEAQALSRLAERNGSSQADALRVLLSTAAAET